MMVIFEYTLSSFHANKKTERGKRLPPTHAGIGVKRAESRRVKNIKFTG